METVNFMAKRFKTVGYTFVGKLYHCAVNHPSGLRLNKKGNYLANQVKICVIVLSIISQVYKISPILFN
jgi:hypothetical protein